MTRSEAGRLGGLKVLEIYGRKHFTAIGAKGFAATVARHWGGDRLAYREYLSRKGWEAVIDSLADRMLGQQLEAGAAIASVELPVMADFDDPDLDDHSESRWRPLPSRETSPPGDLRWSLSF